MKVFLSWSGERSQKTAELLSDWLKCVIQICRPWISSRDIDRGSLWFNEIHDQLKDTSIGIICLTQENKLRPWILFEAGALAKGLSTSRVCTLLIDLEPKDVEDPLAQFNHTSPNKQSLLSLVKTLNGSLSSGGLDDRVLDKVFETYWEQFEKGFAEVLSSTPTHPKAKPRERDELLSEILDSTRSTNSRMRQIEGELSSIRHQALRRMDDRSMHSIRRRIRDAFESGMTPSRVFEVVSERYSPDVVREEIDRFIMQRATHDPIKE